MSGARLYRTHKARCSVRFRLKRNTESQTSILENTHTQTHTKIASSLRYHRWIATGKFFQQIAHTHSRRFLLRTHVQSYTLQGTSENIYTFICDALTTRRRRVIAPPISFSTFPQRQRSIQITDTNSVQSHRRTDGVYAGTVRFMLVFMGRPTFLTHTFMPHARANREHICTMYAVYCTPHLNRQIKKTQAQTHKRFTFPCTYLMKSPPQPPWIAWNAKLFNIDIGFGLHILAGNVLCCLRQELAFG